MSLARISEGQPRLSMFTLGIIALLIEQMRSSCGNRRSRAVARESVANLGANPLLIRLVGSINCPKPWDDGQVLYLLALWNEVTDHQITSPTG